MADVQPPHSAPRRAAGAAGSRVSRWALAFLSAGVLFGVPNAAQRSSRGNVQPNVLMIVLDDVGTDKIRIYGQSDAPSYASAPYCGAQLDPLPYPKTPVLEELAAGTFRGLLGGGIRFDRAYSTPICCPSRACIQTGRYGFRNGLGVVDDGAGYRKRMSNAEVLIPELLRKGFPPPTPGSLRRYRSGAFGKWHLSALPVCDPSIASDFRHPIQNGFQVFEGTMGNVGTGSSNPGDHYNWTKVIAKPGSTELIRYEVGSTATVEPFQFSGACTVPGTLVRTTSYAEENYSASVTRQDAVEWINAQSQPFFAYVCFNAPHFPYQVPPLSLLSQATRNALQNPGNCGGPYCAGQVAGTGSSCGTSSCSDLTECTEVQTRLFYNAMLEAVDTEIGNLLEQMDPAKRANTIVIVMGDNGTPDAAIESALHQTGHGKGSFYEIGVHVPLIVAGAPIPPGAHQTSALVHAVDLWSTVADLTGASATLAAPLALDSISFRNQLLNPGAPSARTEVFCQGFGLPGAYEPTAVGPYELACQDPSTPGVFAWRPQNLGSHGRSLSDGRYKLIVLQTVAGQDVQPAGSPDTPPQYSEELYDLLADPEEMTDLIPQLPGNSTLTAIRDQLRARITLISGY